MLLLAHDSVTAVLQVDTLFLKTVNDPSSNIWWRLLESPLVLAIIPSLAVTLVGLWISKRIKRFEHDNAVAAKRSDLLLQRESDAYAEIYECLFKVQDEIGLIAVDPSKNEKLGSVDESMVDQLMTKLTKHGLFLDEYTTLGTDLFEVFIRWSIDGIEGKNPKFAYTKSAEYVGEILDLVHRIVRDRFKLERDKGAADELIFLGSAYTLFYYDRQSLPFEHVLKPDIFGKQPFEIVEEVSRNKRTLLRDLRKLEVALRNSDEGLKYRSADLYNISIFLDNLKAMTKFRLIHR